MKTWQYITIFAMLALILGYQKRLISRYDEADRRLARCEADVMQWSKLAEYAAEFHAVPDGTAEIDTAEVENNVWSKYAITTDSFGNINDIRQTYKAKIVRDGSGKYVPIVNAQENKTRNSKAGNGQDTSTCYIGEPFRIQEKSVADSLMLKVDSDFRTMWFVDEYGNETTYRRINGRWILQSDTIRIAVK